MSAYSSFGFDRPPYMSSLPPRPPPRLPSPPQAFYDGPSHYNPQDIEPGNTGILLNNRNYQVADRHIPGAFSKAHSLITKSKSSPIPNSQLWTIQRVAGDVDNAQAAVYYNVPDGSVTYRLFSAPNDQRAIEISESQGYIWTISVAKDDRSGSAGFAGKSLRIFTSIEGVDMYWTLDPDSTSGKVILAPWDTREAESQTWTLLREVDTQTWNPKGSR
ncbi:hypothetical protein BDP27DRAFT_1368495 [Rhodocollybia butyracea]|uniref:Uncharacterized protein n=1 Tax=Rhodocollybia butyracea TaxID=206335 RepID=A0A9P5U1X9_9AGAR|nr:hypothetical protein BDP27DRAFT_1368495 [Rhodocollybia butyracea]